MQQPVNQPDPLSEDAIRARLENKRNANKRVRALTSSQIALGTVGVNLESGTPPSLKTLAEVRIPMGKLDDDEMAVVDMLRMNATYQYVLQEMQVNARIANTITQANNLFALVDKINKQVGGAKADAKLADVFTAATKKELSDMLEGMKEVMADVFLVPRDKSAAVTRAASSAGRLYSVHPQFE